MILARHWGWWAESACMIRSFVDCLLTGEEFHVSLEDAANTSLAILAIMESAEKRMPVDVELPY